MIKVFAKDLLELLQKPYLGVWFLAISLCLVWIAGNSNTRPPIITAIIQKAPQEAVPSFDLTRNIVKEYAEIEVAPTNWDGKNVAEAMRGAGAQLAFRWDGRWLTTIMPDAYSNQELVISLAYQISASLLLERPWEVELLERDLSKESNRQSKIYIVTDRGCAKDRALGTFDDIDFECVEDGDFNVMGYDDFIGHKLNSFYASEIIETNSKDHENVELVSTVIALFNAFLPFLIACSLLSREWENGTLPALLVVSGVSWFGIIAGKFLVSITLTSICFFCMLIISFSYFDIPVRLDFMPILVVQIGAMSISAFWGLAASTFAKSQFQAYFLSALYMFCLIFLTGIAFSISNASKILVGIAQGFPLTFSRSPLSQWLIDGSSSLPLDGDLLTLGAQLIISMLALIISAHFARKSI